MKRTHLSRIAAIALSALLAATSLYSCTEQTSTETDDTTSEVTVTTEETEESTQPEEQPQQPAVEEVITEKTVYVNASTGNDENDGATPETAVKTLKGAFELLNACDDDIRTVVVSGEVKAPTAGDFPSNSHMITITGDGSGNSILNCNNNGINLCGPVTVENIELRMATNNKFISTNGNALIIGEGITRSAVEKVSDSLNIHLGNYNANSAKETLTVKSDVSVVHVGAYYNSDTHVTENVTLTLDNGNIGTVSFGADGWQDTQMGVVFTGNVNLVYNGGNIGKISFQSGNRAPAFESSVSLIANNGLAFPEHPEFNALNGLYQLNCEQADGSALAPTDTAGTYSVTGTKRAIATREDGKEYVSASGLLTVPAGKYTVTFADGEIYSNDGGNIEILADCKLDLATVRHADIDGMIFVGWEFANGKKADTDNFKKGDKLCAKYVKFDINTDLAAPKAALSVDGNGIITFTSEKTDAYKNLNVQQLGIVAIQSEPLGTNRLVLDGEYNGVKPIIIENGADAKQISGAIKDITPEECRTMYTACAYCTYTDICGEKVTIYSQPTSTNFYNLSIKALNSGEFSGDALEFIKGIVDAARDQIRQEYLNQEKIDIVGTSADKKTWIYQLADCGIMVREVDIDTGSDKDPIEIVQLTDLHFNYCNERDFEEANPSVMSTYKGRKWLANGASAGNAKNSLRYASFADQVVITGDMLDYMSWGCIELAKTIVFDPYPSIMATLGNHEATRVCQHPEGEKAPDSTTLESRMEILQENWIHDIYYYSKVLDERVMLIQMDNGAASCFWESQIEPFKADLELAREKGYTVLLFYHIPLCTNNPAETDLYPIRCNDTNNYNFVDNYIGKEGTEGASKVVYDLIVNNADIIKGAFCGHKHSDYYTEIIAKTADGKDAVIPQYVLTGNPYDKGHALKITVK